MVGKSGNVVRRNVNAVVCCKLRDKCIYSPVNYIAQF